MSHDPGPDAFRLDRPGIRASFDRASAHYEAAAVLQARVNEELMSRLELFKFQPRVVLDLGTGTGRGAEELKRRYRRALVVAVDMAPGMLREAQRRKIARRRQESWPRRRRNEDAPSVKSRRLCVSKRARRSWKTLST